MSTWFSLLDAMAVAIFGSILSAFFCNALNSKRNWMILWSYIVASLLLQGWLYNLWGGRFLQWYYPLIVHLPLFLLLWILTKQPLWSVVCVLSAYLCCQLRRWLALLVVAVASGDSLLQDITEIILTLPLLMLLVRFVAPVFCRLGSKSIRSRLRFGVVPIVYYLFDYLTVVYTDLLISGNPLVVEFMPFVCCIVYLVFLLYNASAEAKQQQLQQVQDNLDIQLKQSVREISALRQSQLLASRYHHDLRHHLQFISACLENSQPAQAQVYIHEICDQIASQAVQNYCENEAANLIFSSFDARAKQHNIALQVQGALPAKFKLPDSDLCVLLSNALENALNACLPLSAAGTPCTIDVQFYEKGGKLFLQIANPCTENVRFEDGIPVTDRPGHGIGVQSICAIVARYDGVHTFLVENGMFILRLSL